MYLVLVLVKGVSGEFNTLVGVRGCTDREVCRQAAHRELGLTGDWQQDTKFAGSIIQQLNSAAIGLPIIVAR